VTKGERVTTSPGQMGRIECVGDEPATPYKCKARCNEAFESR